MRTWITTLILFCAALIVAAAPVYTLNEQWVSCGNGIKLLDPYYSDGVTFTWDGPSKEGKAHGIGTAIKYKNGKYESTYIGEYKNGIREGKGKFTHMDGTSKTGTFVAGQLMGLGTMESENGDSYEGEFINYRLHGKGKARLGNGSTFEGYFVSDAPYTGKWTNYDGQVMCFQKGHPVDKINEKHTGYVPKIGSRVTEYFDENWEFCDPKQAAYYRIITYEAPHKPKGTVKDFYISGELQSEFTMIYADYEDQGKNFQEGKSVLYYPSGQIQEVLYYFNNKQNGPWVKYYESGQKQAEAYLNYGDLDGNLITYYEGGEPHTIGIYEKGKLKNNKYLEFSQDGETCTLAYNEDFVKNKKTWEYRGSNGYVVVNDDNSITLNATPNRNVSGGIFADFSPKSNNMISIVTRRPNASSNSSIGILFGFKDWENFCGFYISGTQYTYNQVKNGRKVVEYEWFESNAIEPEVNAIKIVNIGNDIAFDINGTPIGRVDRPKYDGGYCVISLFNFGNGEVTCDAGALSIFESVDDINAIKEYLPAEGSNRPNDDNWKGSGSGFFINEKGLIATNHHVVDGMNTIEVAFIRNGNIEQHPASVVMSDKQNDLSVLRIEDDFEPLPSIPYNFSTNIKDTGSEVFTLGYPMADVMGEEVKFTDGKISSKTGIQGDVTVYQISVPIQPGNSGGPLFDNQGNLVGITSSGLNRDYFKSENVNYAIKSSYLKSLIDALPQNVTLQTSSSIADLPLTEKIKKFQPYMIYIKVK